MARRDRGGRQRERRVRRDVSAKRSNAEVEIQRILALVPFLVAHPGAAKDDIAARFGLDAEQLEADLELVLMIGVPPYGPGDYIDVDDEGDTVTLRMAESFRRPLQLSPTEGLAVLAAGRALLGVAGSDPTGPLASALDKLAAALDAPDVRVEVPNPEHLDAVRRAADDGERIEIEYWSAGRDELTHRRIDPRAVFLAAGEWYVDAYCRQAEANRLFRVDRIRALRVTGEHFEAPDGSAPAAVFSPRPADPRVTLELAPSAAWVVEQYPVEATTNEPDGRLQVVLAVSEPAFLERLLLRLGPDAVMLDDDRSGVSASGAAVRVLARYGDDEGS
jgi:proteasome accessory factor C